MPRREEMGRCGGALATVLALGCGPSVTLDDEGPGSSGDSSGMATGASPTTASPTTASPTTASPTTATMDSGPDSGTTDPGDATADTGPVVNESCEDHPECATGYCREYSDAPPDLEAVCEPARPGGRVRFTGTVRDLATLAPVPKADFDVTSAIQAATGADNADSFVFAIADDIGRIDALSDQPVDAAIGLIALVRTVGYELTLTGVAFPIDGGSSYLPGNTIHDLWGVSESTLQTWTNLLLAEGSTPPESLPLGDAGGFAIVVRDAVSGDSLAGATAGSVAENSAAGVFYPTGDGMALGSATDDSGIILIIGPALAEEFVVDLGGDVGTVTSLTASNAFTVAQVLVP